MCPYDPHSPPQAVARAGTEKLATNDPLLRSSLLTRGPNWTSSPADRSKAGCTKACPWTQNYRAPSGDGTWPQTGADGARDGRGVRTTSTSEASAAKPVIWKGLHGRTRERRDRNP